MRVLHALVDAGRIGHHEGLVDADEEAGRGQEHLLRAELNALDLARNLAELAGREQAPLDLAAGTLGQDADDLFFEIVLGVVGGGVTYLQVNRVRDA